MGSPSTVTTFLFTDIEQSSRLWEQYPERMGPALARHDTLARASVAHHNGRSCTTGDGMHAASTIRATRSGGVEFQQALDAPTPEGGIQLCRCGLHAGIVERRNDDFSATRSTAPRGSCRPRTAARCSPRRLWPTSCRPAAADVRLRDLGSVRLRDLAAPERIFQVIHPRLGGAFRRCARSNRCPTTCRSRRRRSSAASASWPTRGCSRRTAAHAARQPAASARRACRCRSRPTRWPTSRTAPGSSSSRRSTTRRASRRRSPRSLGIKEEAGRPLAEALVRSLRDRCLLLVLDNCEHLIEACARLAADCCAERRTSRYWRPAASRSTSPARRPIRCPRSRCPARRGARRRTC